MRTYDVRAVINGNPKKMNIEGNIYSVYKKYKEKAGVELSEFDLFYAGYILANPLVREKLMEE